MKKDDRKNKGGSQVLGCMYARGGGGVFRCVLCATRGVGGSKKTGKNAYVINGRPLSVYISLQGLVQDLN